MEEKSMIRCSAGQSLAFGICAAITVALVIYLMGMNGLSPIDDHTFVNSLFQGKNFPMYIIPNLGRFMPATAREYEVAAALFGPSPILFHIIGALKAALCCGLLLWCLILARVRTSLMIALWLALVFSVGFANSAFRLHVGEINALILILIFSESTIFLEKKGVANGYRALSPLLALIAFVAAFFYKETIFVLSLVFAGSEMLRHSMRRLPTPSHIYLLAFASISYIACYGIWHHLHVTGSYLGLHSAGRWDAFLAYAKNDPIIVFFAFPLVLARLLVCAKYRNSYSLYDSFLIAAICYGATYVILGMFNTYYLLPAYGFAVLGIGGTISGWVRGKARLGLVTVYVWFFLLNNAPIAVSDMQSLRAISNNYYAFTSQLADWIWKNAYPENKQRNLVLSGVSSGYAVEVVISLQKFLEFRGVSDSLFKVRPEQPSSNAAISTFYKSAVEDVDGYTPRVGDVVIYNPIREISSPPIFSSPSYLPIFRSGLEWGIPRWTLFKWMRRCVLARFACGDQVRGDRPYTGYEAALLTRSPITVSPLPLKNPTYELGPLQLPERMRMASERRVDVMVRNTGADVWPVDPASPGAPVVHLSYVWLTGSGSVALEGDRSVFGEPVRPGDVSEVSINVKAPDVPGQYTLIVSPVQEGVAWFYSSRANRSLVSKEIEVVPSLSRRLLEYDL
jgi:hypothetical protein